MQTTQQQSTIEKWLFYNLVALIIFLPLPLGSNRIWAWSIVEAWVFAITTGWMLLVIKSIIPITIQQKKSWFALLTLIGFTIFTVLQVTLPNTSEKNIEILNIMGWHLYSLDPHATFQHLLKTLAYTCLFVLVTSLVNTEKRIKIILQAFFFSGLFQATYGSLMTLSGIEHIFFMAKQAYIGTATGTFVNRNHFANYLTMCVAAGTALLLIDLSTQRAKNAKETLIRLLRFIMSKKMIMRIGLAVIVVGIVLSRSRMGNTSFFISLIAAGLLWMILTKKVSRNALLLLLSFIVIDLWVVGNWFGFEKVQERLQNTSASSETRDEVIRDTLTYIGDNPIMGTGGGSYYSVYPHYRSADVIDYYNHAHNDYLQFLSEYGIIGTFLIALFVLASAYTAITTMIKRNNPVMQAVGFAVMMVILALIMHSLVDFNLQIVANAASCVILLSLAWVARHLPTQVQSMPQDKRQKNFTISAHHTD